MRILYVGDIYDEIGKNALSSMLAKLKKDYRINLVIANAENITSGRGINKKDYKELMQMGISAVTMGNHTWGHKDIYDIALESNIVIPANYPDVIGKKFLTINYNNKKITIINLLGRLYMNNLPLDCPFKKITEILSNLESDYIIVDFHAEATSEKLAFAYYLDGKVNAVIGTHTHIQTADERMLPNKTLYITDVGMTGPREGIIGLDKDLVISRFTKGYYEVNKTAEGSAQINAVILDLNKNTIERINLVI